MTVTFKEAARGQAPFILGLSGLSRCGKTYSALRLALGMVGGDPSKVFVIDTENGRATQYVDAFGPFLHYNFEPPFSYARYLEAIQAAGAAGAGAIIVDSMSHGHEGEGGMLEQHAAELDRMAGDDWNKRERMNYAAWIKPKQQLTAFVQRVQRVSVPMIFCFRAKDKLKMAKNQQGKTVPVSSGLQPICSPELAYEMSTMLTLCEGSQGVPDRAASTFRDPFDKIISGDAQLDEALGRALAEWQKGGAPAAAKPQSAAKATQPADPTAEHVARFNAAGTTEELRAACNEVRPLWEGLSEEQQRALTDAMQARKAALSAPPPEDPGASQEPIPFPEN